MQKLGVFVVVGGGGRESKSKFLAISVRAGLCSSVLFGRESIHVLSNINTYRFMWLYSHSLLKAPSGHFKAVLLL